ncbi:DnaJ domain-containing protein [Thalassospiraceae bacterium LMO-JJ14]|nr:DnaJ domain-containing protein [Thalassospiraceae bacterium LMO-JJ14]
MARRKQLHPSLVMRDDVAEDIRLCEWPDCQMKADHKAPRSREQLREYRWFCLDHVREFNRRWNYFEGMTDDEVEADLRRDTVWQRPSWPLGDREETARGPKAGMGPFGIDPDYFVDDFGLFKEKTAETGGPQADAPTRVALAVFGMQLPVSGDELKSRYKELVKKHHPDTNGGTKAAEEKFKEIREAYETLRHFLVI